MSGFARNTAKLLAGNIGAQVIGILAIPFITRLYSAEAFGVFSVLLSLATILSSVSTLGLYLAILIPKNEYEARSLVKLSFYILVIFTMVTIGVLVVIDEEISKFVNGPENLWLVYAIPVLAFFQGLHLIASYWSVRLKSFGLVAGARVIEGVLDRGFAVGAGLLGWLNVIPLLLAKCLGVVSSLLFLGPQLIRRQSLLTDNSQGMNYRDLMAKYRGFLLYNSPSMLLISSMLQLPAVIIAASYSPAAAGYFAMANRIVGIPIQALGNALSKTVTQHVAGKFVSGDIIGARKDVSRLFNVTLSYLLVPFLFLTVTGEWVFSFFLGAAWSEAGELVQVLSVFAMSTLLSQAFGGLFDIAERQKVRFLLHTVNFVVRIGVVTVCSLSGANLLTTIVAYSISSTLMNLVSIQLLMECVGGRTILLESLQKNLIFVFAFYFCAYVFSHFSNGLVYFLEVGVLCLIWLGLLALNVKISAEH